MCDMIFADIIFPLFCLICRAITHFLPFSISIHTVPLPFCLCQHFKFSMLVISTNNVIKTYTAAIVAYIDECKDGKMLAVRMPFSRL